MQNKWWKNAVIYEIYCRSFFDSNNDGIGDLEGVIQKLPYLHKLGINCIWFTPIYTSPQVDNGYDVADYSNIDTRFGNLEIFKKLLNEAHALGIKVIMDMVLNHSSDECEWFKKSRESKDNYYRDFYYWRAPKKDGSAPNNWGNVFHDGNGSAWKFDEKTGEYYLHLYAEKMPDLNWESKNLRKEVYSMMNGWLKMGVDGFRLDVICRLKKPKGLPDSFENKIENTPYYRYTCDYEDGLDDILKDIRKNTWGKPEYDAFAIGETSGIKFPEDFLSLLDPKNEELDLLYHFLIAKRFSKPIMLPTVKMIHSKWSEWLPEKGIWPTNHLSTHDQPRQISKFGSERYRVRSGKALAMMNFILPGTPIIYQGEEIGMTNTYFDTIEEYNDRYTVGEYNTMVKAGVPKEVAIKKLRKESRDNARTPVQWTAGKNAGFSESKPWLGINKNYKTVNVEKALKNKDSLFYFYSDLIKIRNEHPAVLDGDIKIYDDKNERTLFFKRSSKDETLFVVLNISTKENKFKMPDELKDKKFECILSNTGDEKSKLNSHIMKPYEANLYKLI